MSLIDKYNKSVDSIKSQELAIEKVKNKLAELTNGNKTPTSIKNLGTELKNAEKEVSKLQKEYDDVVNQIENKNMELEWAKNLGDNNKVASINVEQGNLDTKSLEIADKLEGARDKAEKLKASLEQAKLNPSSSVEVQELSKKLEIAESKLSQTKETSNRLKGEVSDALNQKSTIQFGKGIDQVSSKIDKFKNRVTRLISTVAVFSLLRSHLTSLRNGYMTLLNSNEDFKASLNQVKANLMTAFAPIYNACLPAINSLMNALSKITGTIAVFVSGLFGTSLEDAKNQAKGLSSALDKTSKSGKKASGSLASFDKLEVINDSSSGSGGGSDSSGINYDGEIQYSQKLLDFLNQIKKFVVENKELIIGLLFGIAAGLAAIKLECDLLMGLGIGLIVAGIVVLVQGIIDFMNDPTWDNFATILTGLALILAGVAVAMLAVTAANPIAWIILAIAAIVAIAAAVIKNWDKIKETLGVVGNWINEHIIQPIKNFFKGLWDGIVNGVTTAVNKIKSIFGAIVNFFSEVISKILGFFRNIGVSVGNVIASAFKGVVNGVLNAIENILNFPLKSINKLIKVINKVPGINLGTLPTFNLPRLATGAVIPPRQEFAAILGDQKHGTNIEAPLETIKQADREVMQEFMSKLLSMNQQEKEIVLKNWTFVLQCGNTQFGKIVLEALRKLEKEMGKPLLLS